MTGQSLYEVMSEQSRRIEQERADTPEPDAWAWIDSLIHGAEWIALALAFALCLALAAGYFAR